MTNAQISAKLVQLVREAEDDLETDAADLLEGLLIRLANLANDIAPDLS